MENDYPQRTVLSRKKAQNYGCPWFWCFVDRRLRGVRTLTLPGGDSQGNPVRPEPEVMAPCGLVSLESLESLESLADAVDLAGQEAV